MSTLFDCAAPSGLLPGLRAARQAIAKGQLVVLPTDTVYGIAADAFSPAAVERLLAAKGRDRSAPPPVLVAEAATLDALAEDVPASVRALTESFWPGALTVIVAARSSLAWDLGETRGTVAVRMPDHPVALELLRETGPLAVSSANRSGQAPATSAESAQAMLGEAVAVYLAGDTQAQAAASTIVDATDVSGQLRIVREGPVSAAEIAAVVGAENVATA